MAAQEFETTPYAVRLAKITERWLMWVGAFIMVSILTAVFSGIGFLIIVQAKSSLDNTKQQMCSGFEDVIEKALTPLSAPPNATPDQLASYKNANAQKAKRIREIKGELAAHSNCNVSINQ